VGGIILEAAYAGFIRGNVINNDVMGERGPLTRDDFSADLILQQLSRGSEQQRFGDCDWYSPKKESTRGMQFPP
jgi:hypothetical protein